MLIETLDTARDLGRLKEILGVMVRHGFGDTVRRLGLADRLERAGQALNWTHAADLARVEPPVQVRLALEELGPAFVKFGQILAGRADLFGPEWIAEFEKLHSHVPAVPIDALRPQLREDLGAEPEEVFAWFEVRRVFRFGINTCSCFWVMGFARWAIMQAKTAKAADFNPSAFA